MAAQIRWTTKANNDLVSIIDYLVKEWNSKIKENFLLILNSKLDLISVYPNLGSQIFIPQKIRSILITRHSRLYYRVIKNQIIILRIYDTRKDPKNFNM